MNCSQMKMLLAPFANDELSEEEGQAVRLHLSACARCRSELDAIRSLQLRLSLLQTLPLDYDIADSIIARLRWRTADTHAPEPSMDAMDKLSSYTVEGGEPRKNDDLGKHADADGPPDAEVDFLPDWGLQGGR